MNDLTLPGIADLSRKVEELADSAENYEELVRGAFSTARNVADLWEDVLPKNYPDIQEINGIPADQVSFFIMHLTTKEFDRASLFDLSVDEKKNLAKFIYVFAKKSLELATKLQAKP